MLIHEVSRQTGLTKKAIEYYVAQGLLSPKVLENGYRDFEPEQAELLSKISVLRRLGLGTEEIRAVFKDDTSVTLQKLSVEKKLALRKDEQRAELLELLSNGADYKKVRLRLQALEQNASIAERLLHAFPDYYGSYICLHFATFLTEPLKTPKQQAAYAEILDFLDNVPTIEFPENLQKYLAETVGSLTAGQLYKLSEKMQESVQNPEQFLSENQKILDHYTKFLQSEEYKSSPAYQFRCILEQFNRTSGYYDRFLPAMKRLSPAYAQYCAQLEYADQMLLEQYPAYTQKSETPSAI